MVIDNGHLLSRDGHYAMVILKTSVIVTEGFEARKLIAYLREELKKLPDQIRIFNEPKDIIISPSQEDILFPINKVNNESGYSSVVLNQDDIMPNEPTDEASVSILNPVKSEQSQKTPFQKNETFILMMAILAGLIPLGAIRATPKLA